MKILEKKPVKIEEKKEKKNFIQSWIEKQQKAKIEAVEKIPKKAKELNLEKTIDRNSLEAS